MSKFSISSSKNNSNISFDDFPSNFLSKSFSMSASLLTGEDKCFFLTPFHFHAAFYFRTEVIGISSLCNELK